jgi:four helix bundle protein
MRDFKQFAIWQMSRELTKLIYTLSDTFPNKEKFRLTNQICRAVMSIAANIAEGASRRSAADFYRFLEIALGSANEVECHLIVACDLEYITAKELEMVAGKVNHLRSMMINFMKKVESDIPKRR